MGARGHLVEVELDDERAGEARPPHRRWTARTWGRIAAVVAVGLAVTATMHASQAATRGASVRAVGLTSDLTVPRHALWSADAGWLLGLVDDLLLVSAPSGEGVEAYRLEDGSTAWYRAGGGCGLVDLDGGAVGSERTVDPGRARVVCSEWGSAGLASATVLDPADGRVLVEVEGQGEVQDAISGEYLVVLGSEPSRRLTVWSLVSGEQLWTTAVEAVPYRFVVGPETVAVPGTGGDLAFDLATGRPVESEDGPFVLAASPLADGGTVVHQITESGVGQVAALDADGTERWAVPGWYVAPTIDDGDLDAVVPVMRDDGVLAALDGATGAQHWSREQVSSAAWDQLVARVDGVFVLVTNDSSGASTGLVGLDQGTGEELWRLTLDADAAVWPSLVADGHAIGWAESLDGTSRLVVHDVRTGERLGAWDLPGDETAAVTALPGGLLVQVTSSTITVLVP